MKPTCLVYGVLLLATATLASRTGRIHITEGDPRDLSLYKGPANEFRPGKPLPSYILRSKPTGDNPYGFIESQKPQWDDEGTKEDAIQYYTLDCYQGEPCSQSIPIEADAKPEIGRPNLITHSSPDYGQYGGSNEVDSDLIYDIYSNTQNRFYTPPAPSTPPSVQVEEEVKQADVEIPVTKDPTRYTVGPSVASIYGVNGLGPHYPVNKKPTAVTRQPSTEPRSDPRPEASNTAIMYPTNYKGNKYDPFIYHQNNLKRGSTSVPAVTEYPAFYHEEPPSYQAHYTDSRVFSSAHQPSYSYKNSVHQDQQRQAAYSQSVPQIPLRSSLTWKGSKYKEDPSNQQEQSYNSGQRTYAEYENPEVNYNYNLGYTNRRRQDILSTQTYTNPYVRSKDNGNTPSYFPSPSHSEDYSRLETTTEKPKAKTSIPKRDYFPTKEYDTEDDYNQYSKPEDKKESYDYNSEVERTNTRNKYIGDPTMLNAGIVVTEPEGEGFSDFVTSYDERYGWSNQPKKSNKKIPTTRKPVTDRYSWSNAPKSSYDDEPQPNPQPVNAWTSLDVAKPQWEEGVFSTAPPTTTATDPPLEQAKGPYGRWSGGDMRLTAVPFSRSADSNQKKWILLSRTAAKGKGGRRRSKVIQNKVKLSVKPKETASD